MQKTDIITITLKGAKAKEYFLKRITENLGIRFKEIPKEPLVIEEKGNSEMAVEIFKKALELKFLEEVQFKVEESHKLTEPNKEEDSISNNDKDKANEKGLGDVQLMVLSFLKEHSGKEFLLGELSCNTDCIKSKLKVVLESLLKRNLIEKKKTTNGDVYFVAKNDEVDKNAELIPADTETESVQSDITDSTQLLKDETSDFLREEALANTPSETKRILELFTTPKYLHILDFVFKDSTFSVEAARRKFDYSDREMLPDVIKVLSGEAIGYSDKDDSTYNVDNTWRAYVLCKLDKISIESETFQNCIDSLLYKGLIYKDVEGKFNLM